MLCRRWFNSRALRGCLGCLLRCREQRAHPPCVPHGRKTGVNPGAHAHPSEWEWDVQIALLESNRVLTMLWHPFRPMWQNGIHVKHGCGRYTHNTHKPKHLGHLVSLVCRRGFNSRALRGCLGFLLRCRD